MVQQKTIDANDRTVYQVLNKIKYSIDVFQREYKWERKHIEQLINDLTSKFFTNYKETHQRSDVNNYTKYYLGSLIICLKEGIRLIIDGQQRLTSLTLLLIYLNNLQDNRNDKVDFKELIYSEMYAKKSFNLHVEDREECIKALFEKGDYDPTEKGESVQNIVERYHDIEELFPEELKKESLPYFIEWLIYHVLFVEIITFSDDDAYTIFETMNDRGLNLNPAEMLKGYLISNLGTDKEKHELNNLWKSIIQELKKIDKNEDLEFFKAWLRAKYAETIREGKKGSENEDFEKIGTRFHSWVRDNKTKLKLNNKSDFYNFIKKEFQFYVEQYLKINQAAQKLSQDYESVYYIEKRKFPHTFYYPLILSSIKMDDNKEIIKKKIAIISKFIEMFSVFRSINSRTLSYSSIRYTMFKLVIDLRDKELKDISNILKKRVKEFKENLNGIKNLTLHLQNKRFIRFLLARITCYIEKKSGIQSNFEDYISENIKKPFEIEHIWSEKFEEHKDEFEQKDEWDKYRNNIGALILLPNGFNQSYGKLSYENKLPHYFGQNLLAKSLNPQCYQLNPSFRNFILETKLPFKPYNTFKKNDIEERNELYHKICELIYNPEEL